jgi:putative flippase GtrA
MKVVRYFFVGAASAAVDFSIFTLLALGFGLPWFYAGVTGFILATTVNYFLSIRHVFQSGARFSRRTEITLIFMVSGIGLLINQSILFILIERMSINMLIAKILATLVVFFWNYGMRHSYVFKSRRDINSFH